MLLSKLFLPLTKDIPSDATVVSHQLMLRAGMIRQNGQGLYSILPLGFKVLRKIENIIQEELDAIGANRLSMPTIQNEDLWIESGRANAYGPELLRIKDRHDRNMLYSPTAEEMITDLFRNNVQSYKSLPMNLYQINWKFRDEVRPRFGLLRGREFLMMDAYSFHMDVDCAKKMYDACYLAYLKMFNRMGLKAVPMFADTGPIGGDMSHEFQVLANSGESKIFYDTKLDNILTNSETLSVDSVKSCYAVTEEKFDESKLPIDRSQLKEGRGIEVGQIFFLGRKYTDAMNVKILDQNGKQVTPEMCTFGIGVTRTMASAIEANHDKDGIIWPKNISPFDVMLINLDPNDDTASNLANDIYQKLKNQKIDTLYDDTQKSVGEKFSVADLIGVPVQIVIGSRLAKEDHIEIRTRDKKVKLIISVNDLSTISNYL